MSVGYVTISIKKETQDALKEMKTIDRESYDSVINRLIAETEGKLKKRG